MSRFLLALLLATTSALAAGDVSKSPVEREIDAYLAEVDVLPMPAVSDTLLSAAAEGGVMGWASFRVDVWFPSLDGHLSDQGGTNVDITGELGLAGTEAVVVPRALLSLGRVGFLFDGYQFHTEGSGTLDTTFTFGGVTFTVSEDVQSDVRMTNLRGIMTFAVVKNDFLRISLMGGISYYHFDITVTGENSGTGSVSAPVPLPVLGILGQGKVGPVLLEAELSGLAVDYGDYNVTYLDFQASVGITFLKIVAVRAGYRLVSINGTIEGFGVDGMLDGFFVGASVNF